MSELFALRDTCHCLSVILSSNKSSDKPKCVTLPPPCSSSSWQGWRRVKLVVWQRKGRHGSGLLGKSCWGASWGDWAFAIIIFVIIVIVIVVILVTIVIIFKIVVSYTNNQILKISQSCFGILNRLYLVSIFDDNQFLPVSNISWLACCEDPFSSEFTHDVARIQCLQSANLLLTKLARLYIPKHDCWFACLLNISFSKLIPLQTETIPDRIFLCPGSHIGIGLGRN